MFPLFICSTVIEALKGVEPERRCFRMIGGVLVERTVKDVLPALENNKQQVSSRLKPDLPTSKGKNFEILNLELGKTVRNGTGCKENHFYSLPLGRAEASIY